MIEYAEITNEADDTLHLPLNNFMETGMLITNMEGIGTVRSTINMSSYADSDGKKVNSTILDTRNIQITLRYFATSTKSVEEIRDQSYVYFTPKKRIKLTIKTDRRHVSITGIVESNDPVIFSQEESATVSILCEDPLFYDVDNADFILDDYDLNTVVPEFEFPFENDSLTEKVIELGLIQHTPTNTINYLGEYDIGFTFILHFRGVALDPVFYSYRQNGYFKLLTDYLSDVIPDSKRFEAGDVVTVNTRTGNKTITLLRNGKEYNLLRLLDSKSIWPILKNGKNEFVLDAKNGFEFIDIKYKYTTGYLGV